jgi:hypothetical protein
MSIQDAVYPGRMLIIYAGAQVHIAGNVTGVSAKRHSWHTLIACHNLLGTDVISTASFDLHLIELSTCEN